MAYQPMYGTNDITSIMSDTFAYFALALLGSIGLIVAILIIGIIVLLFGKAIHEIFEAITSFAKKPK